MPVCLHKLSVLVTGNEKTPDYYEICPFVVNYEYVMLYSTAR
jgi:hypothetical protein